MGVVNVTPDSFSDGGRHLDPVRALSHARSLMLDGADTGIGGFFKGLDLTDPAKAAGRLKVGTRVTTRFAERRKGDMLDFWFECD